MNPSAFELAALEARDAVKDIDAEIERLSARKQSLEAKKEVLESLARQLLAVLPTNAEASADDRASQSGTPSESPQTAAAPFAQAPAKGRSCAARKDEWSLYIAGSTRPEEPEADQASVSDLLSESKPRSMRAEGWPTSSPVNGRGIRGVFP